MQKKSLLNKIIALLTESPCSINRIAKTLNINWKTAEDNLDLLRSLNLVFEKKLKNKRTFFLKDINNYFNLPIKKRHQKIISAIYNYIKRYDPTKTQANKIIWEMRKYYPDLPIGWYLYGPLCIQPYTGEEQTDSRLKGLSFLKETAEQYTKVDSFTLQKNIYQKEKNTLYMLKEELKNTDFQTKKQLNQKLMDFLWACPEETHDVVIDFVRTCLLLNKVHQDLFQTVWKYLALIQLKTSLKHHYPQIGLYLDKDIERYKYESQLSITSIVENYVETKYSQDERYISWKKKVKSP